MSGRLTKIAYCWHSNSLTGAQRRFLALVSLLNARGVPAIVLIEKQNALALERVYGESIPNLVSFEWPWWVRLLGRGRTRNYSLWAGLGFRTLFHVTSKRYLSKIQKELGISLWHVSMSSHFANSVPGPALFEVTSPDWAERIIQNIDTVPEDMLLHAVSESVYRQLVQALPNRKIQMAPVMFPNLDPTAMPYPQMKDKEKLIVFAHRFVSRKNGVLFAKNVHCFLDDNPDWRITFRGEGPDEIEIRRILSKYIEAGRVEVGYLPNLSEELKRSRIFVSIIERDNYPSQSVLEAMVHGNALLLSDRGHSREKFFDSNGRMTELDESSLLSNLKSLTSDMEQLEQMGICSFRLANRKFSREKYLSHLFDIYQQTTAAYENHSKN